MAEQYWGPLRPEVLPSFRASLTWGLRRSLLLYSELCVPGIAGVAFVRQLSWAAAGISLTESLQLGRASDVANALEAMGCKLSLAQSAVEMTPWRIRGSRRLPDLTSWSYDTLRRPTNYVVVPFRQSTTRALPQKGGLGLAVGSSLFNRCSLTDKGNALADAFLSQTDEEAKDWKSPGRWIKEWLRGHKTDKPFGLASFAAQIGPDLPSRAERKIVRNLLIADSAQSSSHQKRRRSLAYVLERIRSRDILDVERQIFAPLQTSGADGIAHVLEMRTAMAFEEMRRRALAVTISATHHMQSPERGVSILALQKTLRRDLGNVATAAKIFVKLADESKKATAEASVFATAMVKPDSALRALAARDGQVLALAGQTIVGGPLFRSFKERREGQALAYVDQPMAQTDTTSVDLPFRIWNFRELLKDCAVE